MSIEELFAEEQLVSPAKFCDIWHIEIIEEPLELNLIIRADEDGSTSATLYLSKEEYKSLSHRAITRQFKQFKNADSPTPEFSPSTASPSSSTSSTSSTPHDIADKIDLYFAERLAVIFATCGSALNLLGGADVLPLSSDPEDYGDQYLDYRWAPIKGSRRVGKNTEAYYRWYFSIMPSNWDSE